MKRFTVVIPSRLASNLTACVQAIRRHEPQLGREHITVVDDGAWSPESRLEVSWVKGIKPFIFARNVNLGIRQAGGEDVILLNDDALLETPGGFTAMAEASEGWGIVSSVNNCGNGCQRPRPGSTGVREVLTHCPSFICVYIPRATINAIGLLDERFTAYGYDDNDYVRRAREAGLKVGVFDGCMVDHCSLPSTFRGNAGAAGDTGAGRVIYQDKWGSAAE